jgi:hypothetical protein
MKYFYFFLILWVIFALRDPDTSMNAIRIQQLKINADPDPKPWLNDNKKMWEK